MGWNDDDASQDGDSDEEIIEVTAEDPEADEEEDINPNSEEEERD